VWDGYAAAAVAEAGVQALRTGRRTEVRLAERGGASS
jgi:myo-inositol 2-dehydrogenase/D-chiro-inositol 1-dehydrogenase